MTVFKKIVSLILAMICVFYAYPQSYSSPHGYIEFKGPEYRPEFGSGELVGVHKTLPVGTYVKVTNLESGNDESAIVKVIGKGVYNPQYKMFLAKSVEKIIDPDESGTIYVKIEVVQGPSEEDKNKPAEPERIKRLTAEERSKLNLDEPESTTTFISQKADIPQGGLTAIDTISLEEYRRSKRAGEKMVEIVEEREVGGKKEDQYEVIEDDNAGTKISEYEINRDKNKISTENIAINRNKNNTVTEEIALNRNKKNNNEVFEDVSTDRNQNIVTEESLINKKSGEITQEIDMLGNKVVNISKTGSAAVGGNSDIKNTEVILNNNSANQNTQILNSQQSQQSQGNTLASQGQRTDQNKQSEQEFGNNTDIFGNQIITESASASQNNSLSDNNSNSAATQSEVTSTLNRSNRQNPVLDKENEGLLNNNKFKESLNTSGKVEKEIFGGDIFGNSVAKQQEMIFSDTDKTNGFKNQNITSVSKSKLPNNSGFDIFGNNSFSDNKMMDAVPLSGVALGNRNKQSTSGVIDGNKPFNSLSENQPIPDDVEVTFDSAFDEILDEIDKTVEEETEKSAAASPEFNVSKGLEPVNGYAVQIYSFRNDIDIMLLGQQLDLVPYKTSIITAREGSDYWAKIIVGNFETRNEAVKIKNELNAIKGVGGCFVINLSELNSKRASISNR